MKKTQKSIQKSREPECIAPLPQNIMPVGERVYDNKNIYILQKVYHKIHSFASSKTENESGGVLVGRIVNECGKENTIIEGFIEAKYNTATPTTITFTHETWEYFHDELAKRFPGKKIIGWIHTHPNFGIFLSENDKFIQNNFFTDKNQVAYVVDPIQNTEGFYYWIDDKLEACPGFYIYDKNGAKIRPLTPNEPLDYIDGRKTSSLFSWCTIIAVIISFMSLFMAMNMSQKLAKLRAENENLKNAFSRFTFSCDRNFAVIDEVLRRNDLNLSGKEEQDKNSSSPEGETEDVIEGSGN